MTVAVCVAQSDTIPSTKIPTLNRIADEYDTWKWVFGIAASVLAVLTPLGLWVLLKTKTNDWVMEKIAKEADLKIAHLKAAVGEFGHIAELKKKKILVVSLAEGQQGVVKKVFDGCGFTAFDWKSISQTQSLVLDKTDLILFNDYADSQLSEAQIEAVIQRFKTNVAYFYFGPKRLKDAGYRKDYGIAIDFCNSPSRIEAGILSLLKIA